MSIVHPSRRRLLSMAAALPALTLPIASRAQLGAPSADNPGYFRFTLGEARLTVLTDGHLQTPAAGIGVNADEAEVQAFLTRHFLSSKTNIGHCNHLLIELGEAVVLVDVGSGNRFLDTAGRLMQSLEAAEVDPATITHVVITHAHPDHIWGVRDDFDEALFPDAAYFIGQAEHAYWTQDDLVNQVPAEMQQFVLGAQNSIAVDGAQWTLLGDEDAIAPGIRVMDTPGHTPGHMAVVVESNGQQLVAVGDALTHVYTNFAHPGWVNAFDMDGETTATTRKRVLDWAAQDKVAMLGYHFPFPGVGHVQREGEAYRFVPALWQW